MSKYCVNCGNMLSDDSQFCNNCGTDARNQSVNTINNDQINVNNGESKTNGLAIASFVISLVGLLIFGLYCGLISLVMGIVALNHIAAFPNEKGKGLAIAGTVIGALDVFFVVFALLLTL